MDTLRELTAIMESLGRARSFSELVDRLTAWARQFAQCQAAILRLWQGPGNAWLASCSSEGHSPDFVRHETVVGHDDCLCGRVAAGQIDPALPFYTLGGSFCWGRLSSLTEEFSAEVVGPLRGRCFDEAYQSVAIFPLRVDERIIGSLHLADRRPDHFTECVPIIEAVCRMAGPLFLSYLDRDKEHAILEAIQAALMPPEPPVVEGLEIGVSFDSATDLARLGGDFCDVLDLGAAGVLILVGDVAGKGVEAAGIAAKTRYVLGAQAGLDAEPARFMERTNALLARSLAPGRFVTAAACLLDPGTGDLSTCLAGHPAPLKISYPPGPESPPAAVAALESRAPHNPPLGVHPETKFRSHRERLGPEQVLLLYTDGISEARRGKQVFGIERIAEAARRSPSADPQEVARRVHREAVAFHDPSLPTDDRLVIAVRRRVSPAKTTAKRQQGVAVAPLTP